MKERDSNFCVLIPAYQEGSHIEALVTSVLKYAPRAVVIDDGSQDDTAVMAEKAGAVVIRHSTNKGKGAALETGLKYAQDEGLNFVITMDADGQHDPAEIPRFIEAYRTSGCRVIVGNRMDACGEMPFVRRMTNRFMSWLLSHEMGQVVPDTQNGYRLYASDVLAYLVSGSSRFAAESEVLLNLADAGVKIGAVATKVIYRDEKSKIDPCVDTVRFFKMLSKHRRRKRNG